MPADCARGKLPSSFTENFLRTNGFDSFAPHPKCNLRLDSWARTWLWSKRQPPSMGIDFFNPSDSLSVPTWLTHRCKSKELLLARSCDGLGPDPRHRNTHIDKLCDQRIWPESWPYGKQATFWKQDGWHRESSRHDPTARSLAACTKNKMETKLRPPHNPPLFPCLRVVLPPPCKVRHLLSSNGPRSKSTEIWGKQLVNSRSSPSPN